MSDGPLFLDPRLKLFISADIVGSTALKQQAARSTNPDGSQQPWFIAIQGFYIVAKQALVSAWQAYARDHVGQPPLGEEPRVWKTLGDEILFVKEVTDHRQVLITIDCFLRALEPVREFLRKEGRRLDVKCTIWTAGFPYLNKEIVISGWQETIDPDPENYYKTSGRALNEYYKDPNKSNIAIDYIGPLIDIGFRLASKCSIRKMVVSVDVAYIISMTMPADESSIDRKPLYYDGACELKGVLGGEAYPIFWIDTHAGKLAVLEDKLTGVKACNRDEVIEFCEEFYREHERFTFKPFIRNNNDHILASAPKGYDEVRNAYVKNFQEEEINLSEPPLEKTDGIDVAGEAVASAIAAPLGLSDTDG